MHSSARRFVVLLTSFVLLWLGCSSEHDQEGTGGFTINPEALLKVGPAGEGSWILPNGRRITPLGTMVRVDEFPLLLALSPDGKTLFSLNGRRRQAVTAIDVASSRIVSSLDLGTLFVGLVVSPDGRTIYASGGGSSRILVLGWDGASLTRSAVYEVPSYPSGLALSPDGATLYVANQFTGDLMVLSAATGEWLGSTAAGGYPFAVVPSRDGAEVYVSAELDSTVVVVDVRNPRRPRRVAAIPVQKNPEGMALTSDGSRLYVANSDEDSVSAIDVRARKVETTLDLKPLGAQGYGSGPNGLAFSPDGNRLYIAQAADNKVSVVDIASSRVLGAIPTAWYPTSVALSPGGSRLFVAAAKGTGSGPSDGAWPVVTNRSIVQIVDIPSDPEIAALADTIDRNNTRSAHLFDVDRAAFRNPVPLERGGPSPFKHVLVVVRENKTYDALLGDVAKGDGVLRNCLFCEEVTPNLHALVNRFASGDNYYSNAEISIQGHELLTAAITNVYVEKNWFGDGRPVPFEMEVFFNPVTYPKMQYFFQNLLNHQIPFRVYGEAVGLGPGMLILNQEYVHWGPQDPPWFWTFSTDVKKMDERIAEWELDGLPPVAFMLLPDDHTLGCEFPFPTPRSMVADNDLATGQLVEWLSKSRYWKDSIVVLVEDDPQDGVDHVDAHRSILLLISPYVRRGYISNVLYHEGNLHATLQYILGLPPLTVYDENAQPMWDVFSETPDLAPFTALPRQVPQEISLPGTTCAEATAGLDLVEPDQAEALPGILRGHESERLSREEKSWVQGWKSFAERMAVSNSAP